MGYLLSQFQLCEANHYQSLALSSGNCSGCLLPLFLCRRGILIIKVWYRRKLFGQKIHFTIGCHKSLAATKSYSKAEGLQAANITVKHCVQRSALACKHKAHCLQVAWRCCPSVYASCYCRCPFTQLIQEKLHCPGCNAYNHALMQPNIIIEHMRRSTSLTHQYRSSLCYLANVFVCLHYFLDPACQWVRLDGLEAFAHDEVMMLLPK